MQKLVWHNTNGDVIDLTSGNYGITTWEGFANTALNIQSQQVPFQDGGVFLDALMEQRELSVTLAMNDNGNLEERYRMKRELTHILNPKLGEGYLVYTNDYISKRIKCIPQIPLFETHNSNDSGTPKASLAWTACEPYWEDLEETLVILENGIRKNVINEGDVPVGMKIDIFSNSVTNPEIKNLTENKSIKLLGEFENGIQINANVGEKSIVSEKMIFALSELTANINTIVYSNKLKMFVIGAGSSILTSPDGVNWTCEATPIDGTIDSIAYSEDLGIFIAFVYVYSSFQYFERFYISSDGKNWSPEAGRWGRVKDSIYSKCINYFVALVGRGIYRSVDGINWLIYESVAPKKINAICESEDLGILVAVCNEGYIITSENGWQWSVQTPVVESDLLGIAYSKKLGLFVITGANGTILTSSDGENWTEQTSGVSVNLSKIVYAEDLGLFKVIGENGLVLTSYNGLFWDQQTIISDFELTKIIRSEYLGLFIITGNSGLLEISSDGINWTKQIGGIVQNVNHITYSEKLGLFVAVGSSGSVLTSTDGINWIPRNSGTIRNLEAITYSENQNKFVAVSDRDVIVSPDGINWTVTAEGYNMFSIAYSEELHLFVGGGSNQIFTSPDGINWTQLEEYYYGRIKDIKYVERLHLFIAVGFRGIITTSVDGENWTTQTGAPEIEDSDEYYGVTYSDSLGMFVIVGQYYDTYRYSLILTSTNGTDWTRQEFENVEMGFHSVTYSKSLNLFLAVGPELYASSDGENWVSYGNYGMGTNDVVYAERADMFVLCGNGILKSTFNLYENLISMLSSNSDMSLSLEIGNNDFLISRSDGFLNAKVRFRQKYIGV